MAERLDVAMLRELINEPLQAPQVKANLGRPQRADVSSMSDAELRAHRTQQARDRRARIAASEEERKTVIRTADTTRQALADAAMMILHENGPGAERIMEVLREVYDVQIGAPMAIRGQCRDRRLKPKYVSYPPMTAGERVRKLRSII
ncbi:hypothetical protein QO002_001127 [Pararhizobium capsulatum DSM 1112]|uniref:Uncharacterized protein n=1 Tax=Pararhizobium capsulatum DSM 1112 TaxID=1121113 RepID=A0ABU0BL67_9HYPH|nr:hypothetical protein [Pararhizobium capsulatum]MDQ0318989.1 hypothetical protein [Pararhizobium capsulatum DSM 1112]